MILPLIVTFGVAMVGERFATISSSISVGEVPTTNSVYWVITFTVITWAVIATYAQAMGERGPVGEIARYLYPRAATAALARWIETHPRYRIERWRCRPLDGSREI